MALRCLTRLLVLALFILPSTAQPIPQNATLNVTEDATLNATLNVSLNTTLSPTLNESEPILFADSVTLAQNVSELNLTASPTTPEPTSSPSLLPTFSPSLSAAPTVTFRPTSVLQSDNTTNSTNATDIPSLSPSSSPIRSPSPPTIPPPPTVTPPAPTIPDDLLDGFLDTLLCRGSRNRMSAFDVSSMGLSHNNALIAAEPTVHSPVNSKDYLQLIKAQAQEMCEGDEACIDTLDIAMDHAIDYTVEQNKAVSERSGGRRRLADTLPENDLSATTFDILERVLFHASLDSEEEVHSALEGLQAELREDNVFYGNIEANEKFIIHAAISVAKSSTSYWHEALRDETNNYRRLQSKNIIDCLFTWRKIERDEDHRYLRRNFEQSLAMKPVKNILPSKTRRLKKKSSKGYYYYGSRWQDPCKHCDSWQRCEQCYKAYNLNGEYHYPTYNYGPSHGYGHNTGYGGGYYNSGMYPYNHGGYSGGGYGHGGYGGSQRYDDFFWYPEKDDGKEDGKPNNEIPIVDKEDDPSGLDQVGTFLLNVVYVVLADIVGVIVGLIIGGGCAIPAVAASFLFSALYAICYRR